MFHVILEDSSNIHVQTRKHNYQYAIDGSKENPLEATFAALAGCAGVYALKYCKKHQLSAIGIKIQGKPYLDKMNPNMITKWVTEIEFPNHIDLVHQENIINEINQCAVKDLIQKGANVIFETHKLNQG